MNSVFSPSLHFNEKVLTCCNLNNTFSPSFFFVVESDTSQKYVYNLWRILCTVNISCLQRNLKNLTRVLLVSVAGALQSTLINNNGECCAEVPLFNHWWEWLFTLSSPNISKTEKNQVAGSYKVESKACYCDLSGLVMGTSVRLKWHCRWSHGVRLLSVQLGREITHWISLG